jgi:hypothetical protein
MRNRGKPYLATLALIVTFAIAPAVSAETPTASDFLACNEQAAQAVAKNAPSASPRMDSAPDARNTDPKHRRDAPVRPAPDARAPSKQAPPAGQTAPPTDPSGTVVKDAADPQHEGMDAARADEPGYRAAYKSCMRQRGF